MTQRARIAGGAFLALALLVAQAGAGEPERLDLQVADLLALPGESIELSAKLERAGPQGVNIAGVPIRFKLNGKPIGERTTDSRGRAFLKLAAPGPGDHVVKAVFPGDAKRMRAEYLALLAVRKAEEPLLAVALDWTLCHTDNLNTALGGSDCAPMADAPEVMERLARGHTIVYVTGRARQLRKRTISWLARYGFPRGPAYFLDPSDFATYDVVAFKRRVLAGLRSRFPGLRVGIGATQADLEAYRAEGLRPVLMGQGDATGATRISDWAGVERALGGQR